MPRNRAIRDAVAGIVLLAFFGSYLAMEWTGREPDSLFLIGAVAIVLGAGYHLWDSAMGQGVDAAQELQGGGDDADDSEN